MRQVTLIACTASARLARENASGRSPQTSTYLHASEMGLQESMRRFDAQRGKSVAKEGQTEHPPLSHAQADEGDKDTLH